MTLLELTEPLFQFVCRLNRVARKNAPSNYDDVRSDIGALFATMEEKSRSEHRLSSQYRKMEPALIYFVDSVIAESRLPYASTWHQDRLAYAKDELSGDERFFELLDQTQTERGEEAAERLAVFYTCLGLGFTGMYAGQHDEIKRRMETLAPRIRNFVESDDSARICPSAYEHVNTANLPLPVGTRLLGIVILFVGLLIIVVMTNVVLFKSASSELSTSLDKIIKNDPAAGSKR